MATNEWTTNHFRSVFFEEDTAGSISELLSEWQDEIYNYEWTGNTECYYLEDINPFPLLEEVYAYDPSTNEWTEYYLARDAHGNVNVRPMNEPTGEIFYKKFKFVNDKKKLNLRLPDELFEL